MMTYTDDDLSWPFDEPLSEDQLVVDPHTAISGIRERAALPIEKGNRFDAAWTGPASKAVSP
jgi:hypothetical protein